MRRPFGRRLRTKGLNVQTKTNSDSGTPGQNAFESLVLFRNGGLGEFCGRELMGAMGFIRDARNISLGIGVLLAGILALPNGKDLGKSFPVANERFDLCDLYKSTQQTEPIF